MSKQIILVLALLVVSSATSFAQVQGTPQEQKACSPDVFKYCRPLVSSDSPNTFAILACLQANRAKISRACRTVLESHGQ
jgi:hypothetical protein